MYYRKVKAYIEEFEMIREGDQVIAGVSGGGDSMAMLSCLRQYREEMDFSTGSGERRQTGMLLL